MEPAERDKGRLKWVNGKKATGWWRCRLGERKEGGERCLRGKRRWRVVEVAKKGKGKRRAAP